MSTSRNFWMNYLGDKHTIEIAELTPSYGGLGKLKEVQSLDCLIKELSEGPEQQTYLVEFVEGYGLAQTSSQWPFRSKTNSELIDILEKAKKRFDIKLYREPRNQNLIIKQRLNINDETYSLKVEKTSGIVQDEQTISITFHTEDSFSNPTAKGFDATVSLQGILYYMTNYRRDGSSNIVTRANYREVMKQYKPHLEQIDRILKEHMIFENSPFNLPLENRLYQG